MLSKKVLLAALVFGVVAYYVNRDVANADVFAIHKDTHSHAPDATAKTAKAYLHYDERVEPSVIMISKYATLAVINIVLVLAFIIVRRML